MEKVKISQEKLEELQKELAQLEADRPEIIERVSTARALGDLKENAEYHSARDEQRVNQARVDEVNAILKNYEIVDNSNLSHDVVSLGCTVKLKGSDTKVFTLVSSVESDPLNGKISDESPIGQVLLGKKVGDEIEVGSNKYKITDIS
ncbi:MAG: transcription elongation factor GreA [Candidatus Nomurabacteria bacterium]|nr:MAG: transcription elongation factor GreA [Candidatus Nomurabacteria bacterium]HRV75793.1 transcription elongation factor GreA [Candidatus Saccharimonadales bacterium]